VRKKLALLFVILIVLAVGSLAVRVGVRPKEAAPDFTLRDLNGKQVSLKDFRGKGVVLNFWATWCGPCRSEMPYIQDAHKDAKGYVILTVNLREDKKTIENFMQKGKYTFPVLLDSQGKVADLYQVRGIPTTYFIDKKGIVVESKVGAMTARELKQKIDKIK
jgi:peroxiredoxin